MSTIEIPESAIRDAVAGYLVMSLGENAGDVLREMLKAVLEAKGSYGRSELQNMAIAEVQKVANVVIAEMVEEHRAELEQIVRDRLTADFIPHFVDQSMDAIKQKFTRGY